MISKIFLPGDFVNILYCCHDIFYKPTLPYFLEFIKGILLTRNSKVTKFYQLSHLNKHFTDFHRFLNQYTWDPHELGLRFLAKLLQTFSGNNMCFALDDTMVPKYGKKIYGRATHFDHAAKENLAQYIKGHNWVVMGFLQRIPTFSKWICFPILAELFIPRKACLKGETFFTKIELSLEMVKRLKNRLNCHFTVVADALFAKEKFVKGCKSMNVTLISRLRKDAALYEPAPEKRKRGQRGRRRKKGKRIPSLSKIGGRWSLFQPLTIELYNKEKIIRYHEFLAYWQPAKSLIKVFVVWYPQKKNREVLTMFFSTDLSLPIKKLLTTVAARWSLENTFKDMKQHLGMGNWQCRKKEAVRRSIMMNCIAYSSLILWSVSQFKGQIDMWDAVPWDNNKKFISLGDILNCLKNKCIRQSILRILPKDRLNRRKLRSIEILFRLVA